MTVDAQREIIDRLEALRISTVNYFDVDEHKRDAYDKANEMLDDCIEVVKSYR